MDGSEAAASPTSPLQPKQQHTEAGLLELPAGEPSVWQFLLFNNSGEGTGDHSNEHVGVS